MERLHNKQTSEVIYFLYKTTNLLTNSIYIGVHSTKKINDRYLGSGKALHQAFKTYGKHNFKREILEYFSTKEEMYKREEEIVNSEFVKRPDTYNLTVGGRVPEMNDVIKRKISTSVTLNNPRRGTKDPEHSKRMTGSGNSMYGRSRVGEFAGSKNGMFGKGHLVSGENNPMFKGYFVTPKGKFGSAAEALPFHPEIKSKTTISNKCKRNKDGWFFLPKE